MVSCFKRTLSVDRILLRRVDKVDRPLLRPNSNVQYSIQRLYGVLHTTVSYCTVPWLSANSNSIRQTVLLQVVLPFSAGWRSVAQKGETRVAIQACAWIRDHCLFVFFVRRQFWAVAN